MKVSSSNVNHRIYLSDKNPMEFFTGIHGSKNANFLPGLRTINCLKINQSIGQSVNQSIDPSVHLS